MCSINVYSRHGNGVNTRMSSWTANDVLVCGVIYNTTHTTQPLTVIKCTMVIVFLFNFWRTSIGWLPLQTGMFILGGRPTCSHRIIVSHIRAYYISVIVDMGSCQMMNRLAFYAYIIPFVAHLILIDISRLYLHIHLTLRYWWLVKGLGDQTIPDPMSWWSSLYICVDVCARVCVCVICLWFISSGAWLHQYPLLCIHLTYI